MIYRKLTHMLILGPCLSGTLLWADMAQKKTNAEYPPPKTGEAQSKAEDRAATENAAPEDASPENASPENASPENAAPENASPEDAASENLAPGEFSSETSYEADPINVMALPPEEEYKDEFELPPHSSSQLIAARNQIDSDTAKLDQITNELQRLIEATHFESTMAEVNLIKKAQKLYDEQHKKLLKSQNNFRIQAAVDSEQKHVHLEPGPPITELDITAVKP